MVSENMYESVDNLSSVTEGEEAEADKENVEQEKPKQERQEESLVKMRKKLKSRWANLSKIQVTLEVFCSNTFAKGSAQLFVCTGSSRFPLPIDIFKRINRQHFIF